MAKVCNTRWLHLHAPCHHAARTRSETRFLECLSLCAVCKTDNIFVAFVVTFYCVTGRHSRNGGVHVCSFTSGRVFGCQTCASTTFFLKKKRMFWSRWPRSHHIFRLEKIGFGPLMLPRRSAASPCMSRLLVLCTPPLLIPVSQHQI